MAKFFLTGDSVKGLEYTARALYELERLKREGFKEGARTVMLEKDISVRIVSDPYAGDRVYIHAPGCPSIAFSGFMDAFVLADPDTYGERGQPWSDKYLMADQIEAEQRNVVIPPATAIAPKFYGVRTTTSLDPISLTTKLPIDPGSAAKDYDEQGNDKGTYTATVTTHDFKRIYERFRPSLFTGLLRKVWQCSCQRMILAAISSQAYVGWASAAVGIDYHYGNSYGVIKNANKHYMVKITADKIYYVQADFCVKIVKIDGVDVEIVQLIQVSNSDAIEIGIVTGVQSWSDEIGWAFSYDTPRASIVSVGSKQSGRLPAYTTVTLCHIDFAFDPVSGVPYSTTLTKGTEHIFWSHLMMNSMVASAWGIFNIPKYGVATLGTPPKLYNESVDFGIPYPYMGQVPLDGGGSINIPVYVYYTEQRGMVTCTYSQWREQRYKLNGEPTEQYWVWKFDDDAGEHESIDTRPDPIATVLYYGFVLGQYPAGVDTGGWVFTPIYGYSTVSVQDAINKADSAKTYPGSGTTSMVDPDTGGYATAVPYSIGVTTVSYLSTSNGVWPNNGYQIAGSLAFVIQYSTGGGIVPAGQLGGDISTKETLMSLTLSCTDREAHLLYSQLDKSHSYWEFIPNTGWVVVGNDPVTTKPGSKKLVLYGGYSPIELDPTAFGANYNMLLPHPVPKEVEFHSAQAAFDAERVVYDIAPGNKVRIVKINGTEYPVENQLYGWIGVI